MEIENYDVALKKARLVERNPEPNGVHILDLSRVSAHDETDILSLATQIQTADNFIKSAACGKLSLILEQIKMLQAQAKKILEETEKNQILHNAACNFGKKPGHIYHLYERPSGQKYFSMISPEEWNGSCQHEFIGSFRLENDLSWTSVQDIPIRDESNNWANKLLTTSKDGNILSIENVKEDLRDN